MTTGTVPAFETTVQKTNIWLKDLMSELHWEGYDHEQSYHAMRAVLQALRDRLTVEEAADLAAQLPMLVRGFYYEGWKPARTPLPERTKEAFLEHVADHFPSESISQTEEVTRAVFRVLTKHVTAGEIQDIHSSLPKPIRNLWD